MVKLLDKKVNEIQVKITSLVSIDGFSVKLDLLGETKTLPDATKRSLFFTFSEADMEKFGGRGAEGCVTVLDKSGKCASKQRIYFKPVATKDETISFQTIYVMITGDYSCGGGGGGGGGKVNSVNGVLPDDSGDVKLEPADIGVGYDVNQEDEELVLYL